MNAVICDQNHNDMLKLLLEMKKQRHMNRKSTQAVQRVVIMGFGNEYFRMLFYRMAQKCFCCDWQWSSETQESRWEMLLNIPTKYNVLENHVEKLCFMCKNGISCTFLDDGISDCLVSCIKRIDGGMNHLGKLRSRLRESCNRRRMKMEEEERMDRIRSETGRDFTSGNMLFFYYEWQNSLTTIQHQDGVINTLLNQNADIDSQNDLFRSYVNNTMILLRRADVILSNFNNAFNTLISSMGRDANRDTLQNVIRMMHTCAHQSSTFIENTNRRFVEAFNLPESVLPIIYNPPDYIIQPNWPENISIVPALATQPVIPNPSPNNTVQTS